MNRYGIMATCVVVGLLTATVGYGEPYYVSYTSDFESGTTEGWYVGGAWWNVVENGTGVGGSYGNRAGRGDGTIYWAAGVFPGGEGTEPFVGNLQSKYGDQFKISWAMKDLDDGSPSQVTIKLDRGGFQWARSFTTPLSETEFITFDTGLMDARWTDAEAIAAGWTKVGSSYSWRDTVTGLWDFYLFSDGKGNWQGNPDYDAAIVDNIRIQSFNPVTNMAVLPGVKNVGVMQEGGRIIWWSGGGRFLDLGGRIHDNDTGNSSLLYVDPASLIAYRGTGFDFGGIARSVTEVEIVENWQRVVSATVYYDGGSQAFGPFTPAGLGMHSTVLALSQPVDTRFVYVAIADIDGGGGREDIVDIKEMRVRGEDIAPASRVQAVAHTLRGYWGYVGSDFGQSSASPPATQFNPLMKFAADADTTQYTQAINNNNLQGSGETLDLDLGSAVMTMAIGINQAVSLRNGGLYNRIKTAKLEFSNASDFSALVATRTVGLADYRAFQLRDYDPVTARYVRLSTTDLYTAGSTGNGVAISGVLFHNDRPPARGTVIVVK